MKPRATPLSARVTWLVLLSAVAMLMTTPKASEEKWDAPKVHIVSPQRAGYVMAAPSSQEKALISIEVIDAGGAGIQNDTSGLPRFVDPNHNVDVFLSYVVAKGKYRNKLGQEVLQFVSLVPVEKIKMSDALITPPIDYKRIRPEEGERQFTFPRADMVESATFNFQVKDLHGVSSDADAGLLTLGFATRLWAPPLGE